MGTPHLLLASQSPRRRELLAQIGIGFTTVHVDVDESAQVGETPAALVERLALAKARAGLATATEAQVAVLGADTVVVIKDEVLGKPRDREDSQRMLRLLSGKPHTVYSAVALVSSERAAVRVSASEVRFRTIDETEMEAYWQSGEPKDKAGGYAIQGLGAGFVTHLQGSYSAVMGLPLHETTELLRQFGVDWLKGAKST
jgi:septum formation protein